MTHKGFKNEHHKKGIHLEIIKNLGGERVFSYEVAEYLTNIGYVTNTRIVGQYLGKLKELNKELKGGRWTFTLNTDN